MRIATRITLAVSLAASTTFAQSADQKLNAFAEQVRAERKKLGLDKKGERFPTPEVKFQGATGSDGAGVVCPEGGLVVNLQGVPPKSLVLPRTDDLQVSQERWTGTTWTGTLTARKGAPPQAFALDVVLGTTGQHITAARFLLGCRYTLTFEVEGTTLTVKADARELNQQVKGEWKKGTKVLGQRPFTLSIHERNLALRAELEEADQLRMVKAMETMMSSPRMKALDTRMNALMKKMEACTKLAPEKMGVCIEATQGENEKIAAERNVLQAEADKAAAPLVGCTTLEATLDGKGEATGCAGSRSEERLPMKWSWTSP